MLFQTFTFQIYTNHSIFTLPNSVSDPIYPVLSYGKVNTHSFTCPLLNLSILVPLPKCSLDPPPCCPKPVKDHSPTFLIDKRAVSAHMFYMDDSSFLSNSHIRLTLPLSLKTIIVLIWRPKLPPHFYDSLHFYYSP